MNINSKIFKAYDVRGVYPTELNVRAAFLIGVAFAQKTKAKQVVIGRDMRLGGEILKKSLIKGLSTGGAKQIIDIGLVPIDAVYYSLFKKGHESGIMITASHNPKEYNGFKMVGKGLKIIRGSDLLSLVKKLGEEKLEVKGKAKIVKKDIYQGYVKHVMSFVKVKNIKSLKVVVDAGNGMAGKMVPLLGKLLPIKIIPMNFKLDGNFPAHPSNPLDPKSQVGIIKRVKKEKADFGVIFDGDTDRLFFVDEKGKFILADMMIPLLAKLFLEKYPGKGVGYNLLCSQIVKDKIIEYGGRPIRTAVGFVNVAEGLKKHNGIMGGEVSAHYSFKDNGYFDSGFIAWLILLELVSKEDKKLSELLKPFYKYHKLPETNYEVKDIQAKLKEIKNKYSKYKKDYLDGVTVNNWTKGGWWINVRPSNTEPLLRLNIEAKNKKQAIKLKKELVSLIKK